MHYLISGLAKSGTTRLFSQMGAALASRGSEPRTFFEPETDQELADIVAGADTTLSKVLIGRVKPHQTQLAAFSRHVLIYRDPRDQFISMLLYLFYDFQVNGDVAGYRRARQALARKVAQPGKESTIALYNELAGLVGRGPVRVFSKLHELQRLFQQTLSPFALRYEDLLSGEALPALETYLELPLPREAEVAAEYARVARSKGYGEWRHWLNAEDLAFVNQHWGAALKRLGYEQVTSPGELRIDERLSLDYVAQFDPSP